MLVKQFLLRNSHSYLSHPIPLISTRPSYLPPNISLCYLIVHSILLTQIFPSLLFIFSILTHLIVSLILVLRYLIAFPCTLIFIISQGLVVQRLLEYDLRLLLRFLDKTFMLVCYHIPWAGHKPIPPLHLCLFVCLVGVVLSS
jgi:hypothetical protein